MRAGALLAAVLVAGTVSSAPAAQAAPTVPGFRGTQVLLLAVPDLRWSDVERLPRLRELAEQSSVANLSVRSSGSATRCGDGLLELSAGTRVPSGVTDCAPPADRVARLAQSYRSAAFRPHVGLLGSLIGTARAIGPGAQLIVTRPAQAVEPRPPDVTVAVDDQLYDDNGQSRSSAGAALDKVVGAQLDTHRSAVVIVAGVSDARTGPAHLHPLLVRLPGQRPGTYASPRLLTSASTGRTGYVQLVDVSATILAVEGIDVPSEMIGRPVARTAEKPPSLADLADADTHARAAADVSGATRNTLALLVAGALLLWTLGRREARWLATAVAAAPVLTYLVQVLPWWRWGLAAYAGIVVAGTLVVGLAAAGLRRRDPWAAAIVVPAFTALVLIADQLAGAPLQLSAPMGDNPLVAGRFHGMGNMAFALLAGSMLWCAALLASRLGDARRRAAVVVVLGLLAVVVDGAPFLGDDLGGVLALVPAVALLAALLAGVRVTARRVALVAAVTVSLAVLAAGVDAARPAASRTHIGRFAVDLAHGHLDPVLDRKWRAMLRSFGNVALDVAVVAAVVSWWRSHRTGLPAVAQAPNRAAVAAAAVLGVIGTLVNDSGVVVAAGVVFAVAPSLIGDTREQAVRR